MRGPFEDSQAIEDLGRNARRLLRELLFARLPGMASAALRQLPSSHRARSYSVLRVRVGLPQNNHASRSLALQQGRIRLEMTECDPFT
jgi:hypothetical protein